MRYIIHILLGVLLFSNGLYALDIDDMKKIKLKKDETQAIYVKYDVYTRLVKFRWTLYKNEGLIVFHSYDKRVAQTILYLNTVNQSFKIFLKAKGADAYEVPYLLVMFKKFDFKEHKAEFEVYISDKNNQIELEYIDNKKKKIK